MFTGTPTPKRPLLLIRCILLMVAFFVCVQSGISQFTVTGSNGVDGIYTSLTANSVNGAFYKINSVSQANKNITITVTGNSTSETGAVALTGVNGMWTSLTIYPTGNPTGAWTISGAITAPLIDLSGADNVTIDGRLNQTGAPNSLIISNTSTSNTAGTSTIRFINDATYNTVKYCTIKGSETVAASGIIFFSNTTGTTGNDYNTIDHNDITNAGGNRPFNAVFSTGTSGKENDNITISNNNIYDFFNNANASFGVQLSSFTTSCSVTGNSFYETTNPFTPTAAVAYNVIYISNTTGVNFTISGNYIGGQSANCGGSKWTKSGQDNIFNAIYLNVGPTTASNVQGNVIQNLSWTNSSSAAFYGIYANAGVINIGTTSANTIGSNTDINPIVYTAGATGGAFYGINIACASPGTVTCQNNIIGAITAANSNNTNATNFFGINKSQNGNVTISGNYIGSTVTSNSVNATSLSTNKAQSVYGIFNSGQGTNTFSNNNIGNLTNSTTNTTTTDAGMTSGINCTSGYNTISSNTIYNLTNNNANTLADNTCSVSGIAFSNAGFINIVSNNTIHDLSNGYAAFAGYVQGIYFTGNSNAANACNANFIYNLAVTGASSTTANVYGINAASGNCTYSNNIISLGGNTTTNITGFYDAGINGLKFYFNTIYIGGALSSGATNKSYCVYSNTTAGYNKTFQNNIYFNARSTTGGTSLHYAIYYNFAVNGFLYTNYNDYYVSGTGGQIGYYASTNYNFVGLQSISNLNSNDVYSLNQDPSFGSNGGTTASNYKSSNIYLVGISVTGITTDYSGIANNRIGPSMGAWEISNLFFPVEVWQTTTTTKLAGYLTLNSAFAAINAGTHTGTLDIKINGSTTETPISLNSSGSGSTNYDAINIYPTQSNLTINANYGGGVIIFNGSDNVTIDGRVNRTGTTRDLTIQNTNTSANTYVSAIDFAASNCDNITIRYCNLKSSGTGDPTYGRAAVICFNGGGSTNTNLKTLIEYNNITNANNNRPICAIFNETAGTSTITIRNNNFYDFLNETYIWNGIHFIGGNSVTIQENSFYETKSSGFSPTNSGQYCVIYASVPSGTLNITKNYIGGNAPECKGTWKKNNTKDNAFAAINVLSNASIQGNTIRGFDYSNSNNANWYGINVSSGNNVVDIGSSKGNMIGISTTTSTSTDSIKVTTNGVVYGIYVSASGTYNVKNNFVGGINATAPNVYAYYNNVSNTFNTYNNKVVNLTGNKIVCGVFVNFGTISNNQIFNVWGGTDVYGCQSTNLSATISNNNIHDLNTSSASSTIYGINTVASIASYDTIYNLNNTNTSSFTGKIYGMYCNPGNTVVGNYNNNFVHDFSIASGGTGTVTGMYISSCSYTYNNILSFDISKPVTIYGINQVAITNGSLDQNPIIFNTINISGSPTSGSYNSYALYTTGALGVTRKLKDNLLVNTRTNSGTASGKHYCLYFADIIGTINCNFNNYYAPNTGGVLGYYNSVNKTSLPIVTSDDGKSLNYDPGFQTSKDKTDPRYYEPSQILIRGDINDISIVSKDYFDHIRPFYGGLSTEAYLTMGAIEINLYPVEVWKRNLSCVGVYSTLKESFDAINNNSNSSHNGDLDIVIRKNTTESFSSVLNATNTSGGTGTSSYTTIRIYPDATAITVTGNIANPLVSFNGASNVTFIGRVKGKSSGTVNSLTLQNTNASGITLKMDNSAAGDSVRFMNLTGAGTSTSTPVVLVSNTGTNTNNFIENSSFTSPATGYGVTMNALNTSTTDSLVLIGSNTIGQLYAQKGILRIRTNSLTPGYGATTIESSGTLDLLGGTISSPLSITSINSKGGTISTSKNSSITNSPVTLSTSNTTIDVAGTQLTLGGLIDGSLGFSKTSSGLLLLNGANTYTGTTTVTAGTLKLGNPSALGTTDMGTSVTSGAVLDLNGQTYINSEALSLNGTGISDGGALINSSATTATFPGLITLGSASSIQSDAGYILLTNTGNISGTGYGLTLSGTATGSSLSSAIATGASGSLTKTGTGNWALNVNGSNNYTYTGATTISSGKLILNPTGNVNFASNQFSIGDGCTLSTTGITAGKTINATSAVLHMAGNGVIELDPINVHTMNFATSNGDTWAGNLNITNWKDISKRGVAGTVGQIFVGSDKTTLGATNMSRTTFGSSPAYPAMQLSNGEVVPGFFNVEIWKAGAFVKDYTTLKASFDEINAGTRTGTIDVRIYHNTTETATAKLYQSGYTGTGGPSDYQKIRIYPGNVAVSVTGNGTAPVIELNNATNITFDGRLGGLSSGATNNLTLANSNDFAVLAMDNSVSGDSIRFMNLTGTGTTNSTPVVWIGNTGSNTNNVIETSTLTNASGYSVTLNALNTTDSLMLIGSNTTGKLYTQNGIMRIRKASTSTPNYGATIIESWGTLDLLGTSISISSITSKGGTISTSNGTSSTNSPVTLSTANSYIDVTGTLLTLSGAMGGSFGFEKKSNGTLLLSGGNNYTGTTTVSAGTLKLGSSTALGTIDNGTNVTSGAILDLNGQTYSNSEALTLNGVGSGNGVLINSVLTPATFPGLISLNSASTIQSDAGDILLTNTGSISGTGYGLTLSGTATGSSLSSAIATGASGSLIKTGTGNWALNGNGANNYTYTGSTTISSGKLILNPTGNVNFASSQFSIGDGCTLSTAGITAGKTINATSAVLHMAGDGTVDLDPAKIHALKFATSSAETWTGNLKITNWQGNAGFSGTEGRIYVGGSATDLGASNLAKTTFSITTKTRPSTQIALGEVVPEFNKWVGTPTSTDWGVANNWLYNEIPGTGESIYFANVPKNHLVLDSDRMIDSIFNTTSYQTILNGKKLTMKGAFQYTGGAQMDASATNSTIELAGALTQKIPVNTFLNDKVYNMNINNSNNVTLYGTLKLMNALTATSGALDATSQTPTVDYIGTAVQSIAANTYKNNEAYNIIIDNLKPNGVSVDANFTVKNNLIINGGNLLSIPETRQLTVNGTLTNSEGVEGLVIKSSISGTGSLNHNTNNVLATVERYIGSANARKFLSTPVQQQSISGDWTPDGTWCDTLNINTSVNYRHGYDLFVFNEPTGCWVWNLNDISAPKWNHIHPENYFVPGRGYNYALQQADQKKQFIGKLNNGDVNTTLQYSSTRYKIKGFNLIGNPYPSCIDWSNDAGFSRADLLPSPAGYDMWIWNATSNNFGVYNSADGDGVGTNGSTKNIAPMQSFFVLVDTLTKTPGGSYTFTFKNSARTNDGASNWLKVKALENKSDLRLSVTSASGKGSDEIKMVFGYEQNAPGAKKIFSFEPTAPSLYLPVANQDFSVRYLTDTVEKKP